jgi:hypothetical protein
MQTGTKLIRLENVFSRFAPLFALIFAIAPAKAQVQTNVPDVVPSAKPVKVEHIKVSQRCA